MKHAAKEIADYSGAPEQIADCVGRSLPRQPSRFSICNLQSTIYNRPRAFTLIELLVVIAIIALLVSILVPSLSAAREVARRTKCLSNLHNLGQSVGTYQGDNGDYYCPYIVGLTYYWGTPGSPVDVKASPFLKHCEWRLDSFWCPSLAWGSYVPQAGVSEPTTTYGYNAWCLDPAVWGRKDASGKALPRRKSGDINNPSVLFVFADSGMSWRPAGVPIFQNSTSLDPPMLGAWGRNTTPTTHFRHLSTANALCADGHADNFGVEGGGMNPQTKLGFVGTVNMPHYDDQ